MRVSIHQSAAIQHLPLSNLQLSAMCNCERERVCVHVLVCSLPVFVRKGVDMCVGKRVCMCACDRLRLCVCGMDFMGFCIHEYMYRYV